MRLRTGGRLLVATTAAWSLAAIAGCGHGSSVATSHIRSDQGDELVVLVATSGADGGGDARVIGEVVAVGECVGLRSDGFLELVLWPRGTTTTDDEIQFDGTSVGLGDRLDSGGQHLSPVPDGAPEIPTSCADAASDPRSVVVLN